MDDELVPLDGRRLRAFLNSLLWAARYVEETTDGYQRRVLEVGSIGYVLKAHRSSDGRTLTLVDYHTYNA